MPPRSPRVWLTDICEEIAGIRALTKNADLAGFTSSWAMKRAVEHALVIIAEAAKHLPDDMKAAHPEVPWQKVHGLGNLLRHEYHRSDPEILWSIGPITLTSLTALRPPCSRALEKHDA